MYVDKNKSLKECSQREQGMLKKKMTKAMQNRTIFYINNYMSKARIEMNAVYVGENRPLKC